MSGDQRLEIDPLTNDTDSTYGDELSSYTSSITSSVVDYPEENGRRYHAFREGRYLIPNDDKESDRLDLLHAMFHKLLEGKLFLAPIGNSPVRVIDICTGTGVWAMEFADRFPSAEVIGNDLSPIQPSFVPPNVKFVVDDVEAEWAYETSPFDYIHARFLEVSIKDMPRLISQAYSSLSPGGWFEYQGWDTRLYSADGTTKGTSVERYNSIVLDTFAKGGYYIRVEPEKMEKWFRDAGFQNFHIKKFLLPLGTWPKDKRYKTIGAYNLLQAEEGLESMGLAVLTRLAGWTPEEVQILISQSRSDMRSPRVHSTFDLYAIPHFPQF
ncbi:hypothetical protein LOZ65_000254 [Ophidiomyces ophidiicola]|nr:hypothetical protein LOZ65_000254 [Ophidiomyces ophidiicola]